MKVKAPQDIVCGGFLSGSIDIAAHLHTWETRGLLNNSGSVIHGRKIRRYIRVRTSSYDPPAEQQVKRAAAAGGKNYT